MTSIWLAFVIFGQLDRSPPKIVEVYGNFTDCVIEARKRNHAMEKNPDFRDAGFVCLAIKGTT